MYVCMYVCSYGRTDVLALGKFSLNLSRCSQPGVSRALHHLLTNWLTKVMMMVVAWLMLLVIIMLGGVN